LGKVKRIFHNSERGFWFYRNGIEERESFLFRSYCLDKLVFEDGDVVIDCGANSGNLTLELLKDTRGENILGLNHHHRTLRFLRKTLVREMSY
jgi:hypothetical protein